MEKLGTYPLNNFRRAVKLQPMSFNEVSAELPRLTFEERQILIRRALGLDDPPLSQADEELVEARLAAHHADPSSSVPLDEMKRRLRS
jgi:putative addiction module component (TIGR02574 family)